MAFNNPICVVESGTTDCVLDSVGIPGRLIVAQLMPRPILVAVAIIWDSESFQAIQLEPIWQCRRYTVIMIGALSLAFTVFRTFIFKLPETEISAIQGKRPGRC